MSSLLRRFEVLLPLRFNDGRNIPNELIGETILELRQKFSGISSETQTIHGEWEFRGELFRDDLVRLIVDVDDSPENRQFFRDYKEVLKARFQQLDIRITSYPVEVW
jgi:hypothetical protein